MGDVGIVAQRYELVLFGIHQRLELQPWQPEVTRTQRVEFTWEKDKWYTMKLEVQNLDKGRVRARGKVWPKGEPEPARLDDRTHRPDRQREGQRRHLRRRAIESRRRVRDLLRQHQGLSEQEMTRCSGPNAPWREFEVASTNETNASVRSRAGVDFDHGCRHSPIPARNGRCGEARRTANMVSAMKGVPTTWDLKTKKNIKWIAELGSQAYGNPVVSGGYVLVGTNNEAMKDPEHQG